MNKFENRFTDQWASHKKQALDGFLHGTVTVHIRIFLARSTVPIHHVFLSLRRDECPRWELGSNSQQKYEADRNL